MKHIKLYETFIQEKELKRYGNELWNRGGLDERKHLLLKRFGADFQTEDLVELPWSELPGDIRREILEIKESLQEAIETAVNTFAKDETADGYDAKVFLGKFDGTTFKAQSTSKTWPDGTPVTKEFSRGGKKDVSLTGEYQLVDSDRGWWYIQGPKNTWYAVKHSDYGTPPFEY
jgi:hypothetical protein